MRESASSKPEVHARAQAEKEHLLVIDDDPTFLSLMSRGLGAEGYRVTTALNGKEMRAQFRPGEFSLVLLDLVLSDGDGLSFLREILWQAPDQPVVMISGQATIGSAVEAIKAGARDFLEKPIGLDRALLTIRTTLENVALRHEAERLRSEVKGLIEQTRSHYQMVGASPAMKSVFGLIDLYAPLNTIVLITGESGSGKDLAARAIHLNSRRAGGKFIAVNCSNISDELLESELFGHVKGAFTGAHSDKPGLFHAASGGSLFLDEIGDLSPRAQAKVLRAIEQGEVTRVGEVNSEIVDVRLIAATNKDLADLVKQGSYREDLYYRISGMTMHLPPLHERRDDIPLLADHFLDRFCRENGFPPKAFTADAHAVLKIQPWKGNIRELFHVVGRLAVFANGNSIASTLVWKILRDDHRTVPSSSEVTAIPSLYDARSDFEREYILAALRRHDNVTQAAAALGVERSLLYRKMEKLGIKQDSKDLN